MDRQVWKTPSLHRDQTAPQVDDFKDRLVKMIPGEIVATYLACNTAITQFEGNYSVYWLVFVAIIFLMPFYLIRTMKISDLIQIIIMVIAFILWCATITKPFDQLFGYNLKQQQLFSTIALTLFTFAVPIFYRGR